MTSAATRPLQSLDAWEAFVATRPETEHWDLVRGVPVMAPNEHAANHSAAMHLVRLLVDTFGWNREYLTGAGLHLPVRGEDTVRHPDLLVLHTDIPVVSHYVRAGEVALVVEVVSPGNRRTDVIDKRREYARAGIPAYLVIDRHAPAGERLTLLTAPTGDDYRTSVTADDVTLTIDGTAVAVSALDLLR
ncbi:MAG: Uma2 family endonuclease [Dermatophilus congolensis]|nr:Uma2 family endonuclease [Dermatophilus congolensis]